jgi:hypothetical protein
MYVMTHMSTYLTDTLHSFALKLTNLKVNAGYKVSKHISQCSPSQKKGGSFIYRITLMETLKVFTISPQLVTYI